MSRFESHGRHFIEEKVAKERRIGRLITIPGQEVQAAAIGVIFQYGVAYAVVTGVVNQRTESPTVDQASRATPGAILAD